MGTDRRLVLYLSHPISPGSRPSSHGPPQTPLRSSKLERINRRTLDFSHVCRRSTPCSDLFKAVDVASTRGSSCCIWQVRREGIYGRGGDVNTILYIRGNRKPIQRHKGYKEQHSYHIPFFIARFLLLPPDDLRARLLPGRTKRRGTSSSVCSRPR